MHANVKDIQLVSSVSRAGEELMDTLKIDYETDWDKWQNIMALGILLCGYLALAYFQLRRIKIYK